MGELVLVTGGARSGKSRFAERLAAGFGPNVAYIATLVPGDDEMRRRVAAHRRARPRAWRTIEEPLDVVSALARAGSLDACVLDCLTLWVSNLLLQADEAAEGREADVSRVVLDPVHALLQTQRARAGALIVVTNEVGSGLVPEYRLGRLFRDALGEANQAVAAAASRVYLCVAGHALDVRALGTPVE
ncbi:MAG TPA: bifunctional adenosylcobinamide kinase/adenosylcobinamide-phosphate guanylyltransferase [Dehalococcoidia bacterium]|nr:bifunctional adenosylcobinamide kinase/adenosylcobinamide-phosphate guanylyltransferase [Dehalococcoidia bacterium]